MAFFGIRNHCSGSAPTSGSVTTSSSELIAANTARKGVWLQNVGNKTIFLGWGANAAVLNTGIRILKDERLPLGAAMLPTEAINAITDSGTQTVLIQEFV